MQAGIGVGMVSLNCSPGAYSNTHMCVAYNSARQATLDFIQQNKVCPINSTGGSNSTRCPKNCNGNGTCSSGVCMCYSGYRGLDCSENVFTDYKTCGYFCTFDQVRGTWPVRTRHVLAPVAGLPAFAAAPCDNRASFAQQQLKPAYTISTLSGPSLFFVPNAPALQGTCEVASIQGSTRNWACRCKEGFSGFECSIFSCPLNCSWNGLCIDRGVCSCYPGGAPGTSLPAPNMLIEPAPGHPLQPCACIVDSSSALGFAGPQSLTLWCRPPPRALTQGLKDKLACA